VGIFDRLKDAAKAGLQASKQRASQMLIERFPGLTLDDLRSGWLPVPAEWLGPAIRAYARRIAGIEDVDLVLDEGKATLIVTPAVAGAQPFRATVAIEAFEISRDRRAATLRLDLGTTAADQVAQFGEVARAIIGAVLQRISAAPSASPGAAETPPPTARVEWPMIHVDLDSSAPLRAVLDAKFGGLGVLDALSLGPLRMRPGRLELRIVPAPWLLAVVEQIRSRLAVQPGAPSVQPRRE
jgi:hypothetical protein